MVEAAENGRSDMWFQMPEGIKDSRTAGTNTHTLSLCEEIHIIYNPREVLTLIAVNKCSLDTNLKFPYTQNLVTFSVRLSTKITDKMEGLSYVALR
jgi:hypothetical protein